MIGRRGETVFYKSSKHETDLQLSLFINRHIEVPEADKYNVAIILYYWPDDKADLVIFHNDSQISFKRAVRHSSFSDSSSCCWLKLSEVQLMETEYDHRS